MKVRPDQLSGQLRRTLAPIYLVSGDEPLLLREACDAIRQQARTAGCTERTIFNVDSSFQWSSLLGACMTGSLFSDRQLIELRMPNGKPGDEGSKTLITYCAKPVVENVLLIITGKLDSATQKSKWFTTLEAGGVVVQVWPLEPRQLPAWVAQRMRDKGMQPSQEAAEMLATRVEGNLLACAQEIEKLHLLHGSVAIDADQVMAGVADSSRFDIYGLADSALAGDAARAARILDRVREEGVDAILVLWALVREIRALAIMAAAHQNGAKIDACIAKQGVWEKRKPLIRQALVRQKSDAWQAMLQHASLIDRIIKGVATGNVWDELLQLSLKVAGKPLFSPVLKSGTD